MSSRTSRRSQKSSHNGVAGRVRLDRRTKNLAKRLKPGDIAVIDEVDLGRASAQALVGCGVGAVVNAGSSISGRYPNLGPQLLVDAGIPLVDGVGPEIFQRLDEGVRVRLDGGVVYRGGTAVAVGQHLDADSVATAMEHAKVGLSTHLEAFTANMTEYLRRERDLLLDGVGAPDLETRLDGRHVLVVARGSDHRQDLKALRRYIAECRPVLIGVDGGADALLEVGYRPDLIAGDIDAVSDHALSCGAEVVIHAVRGGHAPGGDRLDRLGVRAVVFPATGTSEDLAVLLADLKGASLIVAVGASTTLLEILDQGRPGAASTPWTRLRAGPRLVDAKAVHQLYQGRVATWQVIALMLVGLMAVVVAVATTPAGQSWLQALAAWWSALLQGMPGPPR